MVLYALGGRIPAWMVAAAIAVLVGALCAAESFGGPGLARRRSRTPDAAPDVADVPESGEP